MTQTNRTTEFESNSSTAPEVIEDLTASDTETADVKGGGGRYMLELRDLKGEVDDSK